MALSWAAAANEAVVTIAIVVYAACMALVAPPLSGYPILERDPALSFPYVKSTVPTSTLVILAILVPGCLMLLGLTAACVRYKRDARSWATAVGAHALAIAQALLLTMAITDTIKNVTAYPRPNFFAYCDYAGYREAVASGNLTAYNTATTAGGLGSPSRCLGQAHDVEDAQLSFPSGHSSISFAAMSLATLYARHALGVRPGVVASAQALLASAPLALAAWIAITRVRDRYHNTVDVLCGAAIGAAVGWQVWRHLVAHGRHEIVPALVPQPLRHGDAGGMSADGDASDGGGSYSVLCPLKGGASGGVKSGRSRPSGGGRDEPV